MKKVLFLFGFLFIHMSVFPQTTATINLALYNKLASEENKDEKMFLLVKGDVSAIRYFVESNNGKFLNSAGDIASVKLSLRSIATLIKLPFVSRIGSDVYHNVILADTMRRRTFVDEVHGAQLPLMQNYRGRGVLLGVIDSGLDFRHNDFKDSLGNTRVKWLWDMNLPDSLNTPQPYDYGQEFSGQQIDAGSASAHTAEDQFGHGTYVGGIAAGYGSAVGHFQGVAPEADLIIVGFDFNATDTVPRYAHAIEYIFNKAQILGMPCVINVSLGDYYGSHDGLDLQSQYISYLINQQPGRVVVAAAGNIGINYPFHVGRNSVAGDTIFSWFKYNPSYAAGYIQIFADTADFRNVRFSIGADKVTPYYHFRNQTAFTNVFPSINNPVVQNLMVGANRIGMMQTYTTVADGVYSIEIIVLPDSIDYYWRFTTTGNGKYDSWTFDWIWQNLPSVGTFPAMSKYHAPDTNQSLVNGMACLNNVITVGNYYNTDRHVDYNSNLQIASADLPQRLAENSSRGPTRDGRIKPEITAPGHHIISTGVLSRMPGMISAEPHKVAPGGMHITGGGTSASAPVVAGLAALFLEKNPTADWSSVKQAILNCASSDTFMWGPYPNNAWGFGKANAFETMTTCTGTTGIFGSVSEFPLYNVYPNPVSTFLNVESKSINILTATIYDLEGRRLFHSVYDKSVFLLPVENLANGFYILELRSLNGKPEKRSFVISR